jgi:predicted phage terminase large subunit-like protein
MMLSNMGLVPKWWDDVPGALWSRDLIEACRIPKGTEPPMRRIVVSLDPAVSVSKTSDATGIIGAGLGDDGHGYILEDISGKYSPTQWARRAIDAYRLHKADRIVAEAKGGAMVETTLRAVDNGVPVRLVHASRAKITRAEPISALFEQHRAHMVGAYPELEDELCSFEPGTADSPDRLDSMVWAITDLMVGYQAQPIKIVMPIVVSIPRHNPFARSGPIHSAKAMRIKSRPMAIGGPRVSLSKGFEYDQG